MIATTHPTLVGNAFSINMLKGSSSVTFSQVTEETARDLAVDGFSVVGHADTAAVFSSVLGTPVPMNRATVTLEQGQTLLVGQLTGARLPEGTNTLPEGANISWWTVTVH